MDGVHDLGGMHGFGPVEREENEPPFHGRWEAAVVAIMRGTRGAGLYNIDEFRHGIERMDPAHYLGSSYFEHWLDGIARVLAEKGVVDAGGARGAHPALPRAARCAPRGAGRARPPGRPERRRVGGPRRRHPFGPPRPRRGSPSAPP